MDGCTELAPVNGVTRIYCRSCFETNQASRQCMTPDCTNLAPMGSGSRVCPACSHNTSLAGTEQTRFCAADSCTQPAPIGGVGGSFCAKHKQSEQQKKTKAKAKAGKDDPSARDCATEGCSGKAPQGAGRFCSKCRSRNNTKAANAKKLREPR